MDDENNPAPAEVPPPAVPAENPAPEIPAAPPAAALVVNGTKSEREIELERQLADTSGNLTKAEQRALKAELRTAELERDNQELKKIPAVPKPKKENWFRPVINFED